ncbi:MAG: hypothetical protein PF961_15240 [Planctomycetota bacterium]|jgi:5'(3')-deoxyribonucleotidase|nr:hypothetical protein [Planctomycetota bacterium]
MATILLDLDGVLTDFDAGVCALFGRDVPPGPERVGTDIATALGLRAGQLWQRIDEAGARFWAELPETPWAQDLVTAARRAGEVVIATAPSNDPGAAAGKVRWMQQRFGKRFRSFAITPRKDLLAAPGRLLIDDTPKHVDAFTAGGGAAVLMPTWANGTRQVDTDPLELVHAALAALEN